MKTAFGVSLAFIVGLGSGLYCGHKIGRQSAWHQARRWAWREADRLSEQQIALTRNVVAQRESSAFHKGLDACRMGD